jgi:hypothetical protein
MTYNSVYEITNNLSTIAGQHLIEYFTGNILDSKRWGIRISNTGYGTPVAGVIEMADTVNGGLKIKTAADANTWALIAFCDSVDGTSQSAQEPMNIRPYNYAGSTCIFRAQFEANSKFNSTQFGFAENAAANAADTGDKAIMNYTFWNAGAGYEFMTSDGTTINTVESADPNMDTDPHIFKIDCRPTSCSMSVDGVFSISSTSNLPAQKMGLVFSVNGHTTNAPQANLSYVEAWNT